MKQYYKMTVTHTMRSDDGDTYELTVKWIEARWNNEEGDIDQSEPEYIVNGKVYHDVPDDVPADVAWEIQNMYDDPDNTEYLSVATPTARPQPEYH